MTLATAVPCTDGRFLNRRFPRRVPRLCFPPALLRAAPPRSTKRPDDWRRGHEPSIRASEVRQPYAMGLAPRDPCRLGGGVARRADPATGAPGADRCGEGR